MKQLLTNTITTKTPYLPGLSLEKVQEAFAEFSAQLDLSPIKFKLVAEKEWTMERANSVEPQYRAFLFLIGTKQAGILVPTHDIDEMWHAHILDTRKYMSDCALLFGFYIHHYPYLGMKDEADKTHATGLFHRTEAMMADVLNIKIGRAHV